MKARTLPLVFALLVHAVPLSVGAQSDDASATQPTAPTDAVAAQTPELSQDPLNSGGGGLPVNFLWIIVASILVFWMQAGFAFVEAGFTRAKNAVNILMKNLMDFCFGSVVFWAVGFGLMFGTTNGLFGTDGFFLIGYDDVPWNYAFLLFQTVFAATAATIVSGAMAERTKFQAYLAYTVVITMVIYPIFGSWAWGGLFAGGGWLEAPEGGLLASLGLPAFSDFAGSTVVHSVGGWSSLAGAIAIGPRLGKYSKDGTPRPIPGHNVTYTILGVFILWMGWFGFNAGSTTGVTGGEGALYGGVGKSLALIAVNTNLAGAAGAISAMFVSWRLVGKPDVGITANGALAGLVGVTAGCAYVPSWAAVVIGAVAGALVIASVFFFERRGIDDPVGAVSVHGVCGVWGTLAVALFHHEGFSIMRLASQTLGALVCFIWAFGTSLLLFKVIDRVIGLRCSPDEERAGLDLVSHGAEAYPAEI